MKVVIGLTQEAYEKMCTEIISEMVEEDTNKSGNAMLGMITMMNTAEFKTRLERKLFNMEEMK